MVSRIHSHNLPLHIHITALFVVLTLVLSVVLSVYNYNQSSQLLIKASDDLFDQISKQLELEFQRSYEPISQATDLIAHTEITRATNLSQRLTQLPLLTTALNDRPEMAALGVSYDTGDFFIVRVINDIHMRLTFNAPQGAWFQVDNITTEPDGKRYIERVFFDRQLNQISRLNAGETAYDPRIRPWYTAAIDSPKSAVTDPYLYFFIRKVGITFSRRSANNQAVIAADIALDMLSSSVRQLTLSEDAQLVLMDMNNNVLAYNHPAALIQEASNKSVRMTELAELPANALKELGLRDHLPGGNFDIELDDQSWHGTLRTLTPAPNVSFKLLSLVPQKQLMSSARDTRDQATLLTLFITLLALPVIWFMAHRIAMPLRNLATQAELIQQLRLDTPVRSRSIVKEVDELALTMSLMQKTLFQFIQMTRQISAEEDYTKLLALITNETLHSTEANGVILYLCSDNEQHLIPEQASFRAGSQPALKSSPVQSGCQLSRSLQTNQIEIRELAHSGCAELTALADQLEPAIKVISIPLRTRKQEPLGILCLLVCEQSASKDSLAMVKAMADFGSMTLESRQQDVHQKALMSAFIELIAGAIDAKSPYTAGHCQRVPELTELLVQAACDSKAPAFRNYQLNEKQWEALHIAAWLHDCGKVTTPEYVVDKATKLETIYDRIHEVRMRFEILKRDADIQYWQAQAQGTDASTAGQQRDQTHKILDEEFAFIAQCNIGSEFMSPDKQQRLQQISQRTWLRTLDDRLGIGIEEQQRKALIPAQPLPATESVLTDRQDHLIPFANAHHHQHYERFNLKPGSYQFNRGELYNLSVQKGTLTEEERHIINDHIVQTILMLEQLPYPEHMRNVPQLAGQHHEKMDGTGYPLGLSKHQMPLSSRAMAIADIFEALTAADRPYKTPKTLSEAIRIMSFMCNEQHIDRELFELFLTSGVYLEYSQRFLAPEQLDAVDIQQYLQTPQVTPA